MNKQGALLTVPTHCNAHFQPRNSDTCVTAFTKSQAVYSCSSFSFSFAWRPLPSLRNLFLPWFFWVADITVSFLFFSSENIAKRSSPGLTMGKRSVYVTRTLCETQTVPPWPWFSHMMVSKGIQRRQPGNKEGVFMIKIGLLGSVWLQCLVLFESPTKGKG